MAFISNQQTNPNDPNQQQGPSAQPSATGMASPAPQAQGGMGMPTGQPQPKGSGRFTNIQKYLQANVGAGQRLAGGIGRKVEAQIDPQKQKAESQTSQIAEQVGKAQGRIGEGQRLQEKVGKQDFDVVGFAAQQPNVEEFTKFRTREAIDEAALRDQAEQAQIQAEQAQKAAQGFTQQLGTEGGRAELLKQTFSPTRAYSMGQQRLDNLLLQQGAPQLQALRSGLLGTSQTLGGLVSENIEKQKTIGQLAKDEENVAKALAGAMSTREAQTVEEAEARQEAVNTARELAQNTARTQFQNLLEGKEISQDFAKQVGLTEQDRLFNVLKKQGGIDDYLKFNATLLQGADQLATQEQRQRYDAISRLLGIDPSERRIGLEDKTQAAVESTGALRSRIEDAASKFQEMLNKGTTATGSSRYGDIFTSNIKLQDAISLLDSLGGRDPLYSSPYGIKYYSDPVKSAVQRNEFNTNVTARGPWGGYATTPNAWTNINTDAGSMYYQSRLEALRDAYNRLANEGYYQRARINNPTLVPLPEVK